MSRLSELRTAEQRLVLAMLAGDADALERLLADEATYTGPDGQVTDRASDIELHRSGTLRLQRFDVQTLQFDLADDGSHATSRSLVELVGSLAGEPFAMRLQYTRRWGRSPLGWRVVSARSEFPSA
jgi:hypothetical protein